MIINFDVLTEIEILAKNQNSGEKFKFGQISKSCSTNQMFAKNPNSGQDYGNLENVMGNRNCD